MSLASSDIFKVGYTSSSASEKKVILLIIRFGGGGKRELYYLLVIVTSEGLGRNRGTQIFHFFFRAGNPKGGLFSYFPCYHQGEIMVLFFQINAVNC